MKVGDLVRNKNSESGELGIYVGKYVSVNQKTGRKYRCSEVYWHDRGVTTIQTDLLEIVQKNIKICEKNAQGS